MENPSEVFAGVERQVYILRTILNNINTLATQMANNVESDSNESIRQKFREWCLSHSIQNRELIIRLLYDCKLSILKQIHEYYLVQTPQNLFFLKIFELNAANDLENIIQRAYIDLTYMQRANPDVKQNSQSSMQSFTIPAEYIPTFASSIFPKLHSSATHALLDDKNDITTHSTPIAPGLRPEHLYPNIFPVGETQPPAQVIAYSSVGTPTKKISVDDSLGSKPIYGEQDQQKNKRKHAGSSRHTLSNSSLIFHSYSPEKHNCGKCGASFKSLRKMLSASEINKLCSRCHDLVRHFANKSVCSSTEFSQLSNNNKTFTLNSEVSDRSIEIRPSVSIDTNTSSILTTSLSTNSSLFTKPELAPTFNLNSRNVLSDTQATSPTSDLSKTSQAELCFDDPSIISDALNTSLLRSN